MSEKNLQRMIQLAEEVFATRRDPSQLSVTEETMRKLRSIHPNTLNEQRDEDGPMAWVLVIPTTRAIMEHFVRQEIGEREILDRTPLDIKYDALYLCSALVLPEQRGKGVAKRLLVQAIRSIQMRHPIKDLFFWAFSREGESLARSVAAEFGLPLHQRRA